VSLELGPLSLVSTTEELFGRNSSDFGLEKRNYGRRGSVTLTDTPLSAKVGTNFADKRYVSLQHVRVDVFFNPFASPVGILKVLLINIVVGIKMYKKTDDDPHGKDRR
jgi:hypothetical protein